MGIIIQFPERKRKVTRFNCMGEDVLEIAKYFLSRRAMTLRKLQTLCYLTQCHFISMYKNSLIDTKFEAWANGPSSRELFEAYSEWENLEIISHKIPCFYNKETERYLNAIYNMYGKASEKSLRNLIANDNVWQHTRKGLKRREPCLDEIEYDTIYNGYKNKPLAY